MAGDVLPCAKCSKVGSFLPFMIASWLMLLNGKPTVRSNCSKHRNPLENSCITWAYPTETYHWVSIEDWNISDLGGKTRFFQFHTKLRKTHIVAPEKKMRNPLHNANPLGWHHKIMSLGICFIRLKIMKKTCIYIFAETKQKLCVYSTLYTYI